MKTPSQKPNWHVVVSFKTELLSEYLIHKGYRENLPKLLPKVGLLRNRMIIDNDIYVDLNEVEQIKNALSKNLIPLAKEVYRVIQKQSQRFISIAKAAASRVSPHLSNVEISRLANQFFNSFQATAGCIGIPTMIDLTLEERLRKYFSESGVRDIDNAMVHIAITKSPIGTTQEHNDLLKLALRFKKTIKSIDALTLEELRSKNLPLAPLLRGHSQKYGWLHSTLLLGEVYDESKIFEEIKKAFGSPQKKLLRAEIESEKRIREARSVIRRLKQKGWQSEATFLQQAVYFRTARLEWLNQGCFLARPLLIEIARRLNVKFDDLIYMISPEILDCLRHNKTPSISKIRERQSGYALISDDKEKLALYIGPGLARLKAKFHKNEKKDFVKGMVACRGRVSGRAAIVKDRSELYKVEEGDILITRLTTPDFVVAMKKAAAIVTDLGGLTSHAAIVSRELNIPCVVGTKHATTSFHDGDTVEVDANNGTVKAVKI